MPYVKHFMDCLRAVLVYGRSVMYLVNWWFPWQWFEMSLSRGWGIGRMKVEWF